MSRILSYIDFVMNEGGKVFKHDIRPVSATEAADTVKFLCAHLFTKLNLKEGDDIIEVGSAAAGKPESHDLDFVYDLPSIRRRLGTEDAHKRFFDRVKMELPDARMNLVDGFGITSVAYPVAGEEDKGFVQVDFIPVESMDWARFTYQQSKDSNYKSAHRNWLLSAMCAEKMSHMKRADGELISWDGYMFDIQRGFFEVSKSRAGVQPGKILKEPKKVDSKFITTDPGIFLSYMFTDTVEPKDVESFESLWRIMVKDDKWKEKIPRVAKELDKFLRRVGLDVPEEIKPYL